MNETTNDQSPAEMSPLDGLRGVGDLLRSDSERVARYAEAIDAHSEAGSEPGYNRWRCACGEVIATGRKARAIAALRRHQAEAVMAVANEEPCRCAVADEECAALVADVERLQLAADESSSLYAQWRDDCAARAEAAEAKLAKVEALNIPFLLRELADDRIKPNGPVAQMARDKADALEAVLADAPAGQRAEGGS